MIAGASLGKWGRYLRTNDTDPAKEIDQYGTGPILTLKDAGTTVFEVADGGHTLLGDDVLLKLGTDSDQVMLNRASTLAADTVLTGVLEGTVESQAIAANSLMIANITNDGDIALYVSKAGNSQMVLWADGSSGDMAIMAASGQSADIYVAGNKVFDFTAAVAFSLTLTHAATAARTVTFPDASGTVAELGVAQTFTAAQTLDSLILGGEANLNSKAFTNAYEALQSLLGFSPPIHIPNTGWTAAVTGNGATSQTVSLLEVSTGVGASTALLRMAPFGLTPSANDLSLLDWTKAWSIFFRISPTTSIAGAVRYFQLKEAPAIGALAERGIGIRLDNLSLVGISYGTSGADTDLATTLADAKAYWIEIKHTPSVPKIEWYVDGVLKGTQTTAAKMPSVTGTSGINILQSISNLATEADCNFRILPHIIFLPKR